jgi:hypothetical protein
MPRQKRPCHWSGSYCSLSRIPRSRRIESQRSGRVCRKRGLSKARTIPLRCDLPKAISTATLACEGTGCAQRTGHRRNGLSLWDGRVSSSFSRAAATSATSVSAEWWVFILGQSVRRSEFNARDDATRMSGKTGKEAAPNPNPFLPNARGSHANPRCISNGLE